MTSFPTMMATPDFLPKSLVAVSRRFTLAAGERLFALGAPVEQLHWVCHGEIQAVRQAPSGQAVVIMRGRPGELFAEASLFTPHYTCEAVARKSCVLLATPIVQLRLAMATDAKFSELFLRSTVMALRRQCSRIERLLLRSAAERVEHFLSCEASSDGWCHLDVPLSEWAVDLGLEPETLYRTLKVLEEKGGLLRNGRSIRLISPE
jgi:CRP/FNR family transcriptional regulator, dissimilatory nitrate respiration regulator